MTHKVAEFYDGCWMRDLTGPMSQKDAVATIVATEGRHSAGDPKATLELIDLASGRVCSWAWPL